jgi:beta-lactamase regulating signal transducer with metallopeptidase domain
MSFPDLTFWSHLLAVVGAEVCCLAALGYMAQRFFRPAIWQRTAWQITVVCLLLLPVSEWTGFGQGTAVFLLGRKMEKANASNLVVTRDKVPMAHGAAAVVLNHPPTPDAMWWPAWVWLAGTVVVLGRMGVAQFLLLILRRRQNIFDPILRDRVASVAKCVGLRREVALLRMPQAISPMAFGILRPVVGLPPDFEEKLSVAEQEAVLAHELAHLAAMDPIWFLLADLAGALLWWHPLVWWTRRSLHSTAELVADESAALVPDGPDALAKCLVSLAQEMRAARGWGWVGVNGGFRSQLGKRVERLLRISDGGGVPASGRPGAAARIATAIFVVPAIVLLFGAFQSAQGQKEDQWQNQVRESWHTSPGARLMFAALDAPPATPATNIIVKDALPASLPQLTIEGKFIDMDEVPAAEFQLEWTKPGSEFTTIINDEQFRSALASLERRADRKLLFAPKVTILSGRQAHIATQDGQPPSGWGMDVISTVKSNGYSMKTLVIATRLRGNNTNLISSRICELWDGQTLVLGEVMTNQPSGEKKVRMVLVTQTIIDPMGNRAHTPEEIARAMRNAGK